MNWIKDVTGQQICDIKAAAERAIGHRCTVRQLRVKPNVFEIEFDMQGTSG